MTLFFEEEGDLKLPLECEELAKKVIEAAIDYVDCPYEAEVNLLLTMNDEIHEMNRDFREIDRATDVLSFPMVDYVEAGDFDFLEDAAGYFNPETGELMLGDIVISKEKVISQAEEYGHPVEREYAFLIAHSMLHLFGYDHMEEEERIVMETKQKEILEQLQISYSFFKIKIFYPFSTYKETHKFYQEDIKHIYRLMEICTFNPKE
jgi:probable rRNA maturation factor